MKKAIGFSFVFAGLLAAWVAFVPAGSPDTGGAAGGDTQARGPADHDAGGHVRQGRVQQRGVRHHRLPARPQRSIGEPWVLLEVGMTLRDGVPETDRLTRDDLSLETPDGKTIPLATVSEHRAANLSALQNREKVQRDSINDFPPSATRACRIGFFSELSSPANGLR